jgi:hypothetical protein
MRRTFIILTLALLVACPVRARLGETEEQSIARYGPLAGAYNPAEHGCDYRTLAFNHEGYSILAMFIGGRCEMVVFQKADKSALDSDELDLLLKAESDDQKWSRSSLVSIDLLWDRPDGAVARYDTAKFAFTVFSAKFRQADRARQKIVDKQKLENF